MKPHKKWEKEEGFSWPAWQAQKIRDLEQYRRHNRQISGEYMALIEAETKSMLEEQFAEGINDVDEEAGDGQTGNPSFFISNLKRLDNLISDMMETEERAESSALRMMDDVYRRTVMEAQIAMASGGVTLPKAIDMAVEDFLKMGINSIVYKDGRRVNIADYVFMCLQTAATRSYLQGAAQRRMELGIDTVLVSSYGACSETCLPWQGRVYIDDVWGVFTGLRKGDMGKSVNGKWYPLLSLAVRNGLFHPNCRHTVSTWIEGVSQLPPPMDSAKIREHRKLEQKQRELERQVRKAKRMLAGAVEPETQKKRRRQVREAQKELRNFVDEHSDLLRRDYWREKVAKPSETDIINDEERSAILSYISGDGYKINVKLRTGAVLEPYEGKMVTNLDSVLNKLPVYRGEVIRSLQFTEKEDIQKFAMEHKIGKIVTYPAFTSTSTEMGYHDNPTFIMHIQSKTGRDLRKYNGEEAEVLFPRNTSLLIESAELKDGSILIKAREVSDEFDV